MTKAIKDLYSDSNKINYGITCSKDYQNQCTMFKNPFKTK